MRPDLRAADESWEVVRAAEAWRDAEAIDDGALAAIRVRHADDRRRTRPAFRVLFFLFTLWAGAGLWGFLLFAIDARLFGSGAGERRHATLLALLAATALGAAARALGPLRLRRFGIEEGLVALAIGFETGALALGLAQLGVPARGVGFSVGVNLAAIGAMAAWRWGIPGSGALAATGLFGAFALLPHSRALWCLLALPLIAAAGALARFERAAPMHRRRAAEAFATAVAALYVAVHVSVAAGRFFDELIGPRPDFTAAGSQLVGGWRTAGWIAMVALPAALLASGLRRRDRLALALGALGLSATAASAIDALDLGPAWRILLLAGLALVAAAFVLRRSFARRPDRRLGGFTDARLLEPAARGSLLELAGAVATFTPAPRPPEPPPGFRGEGGEFGGGGASGKF